uniref:Uncharacterized protein n=1 Tax=Arundo donax TaxID=35708 RepID=A0A0A8YUD5_ARUDO
MGETIKQCLQRKLWRLRRHHCPYQ